MSSPPESESPGSGPQLYDAAKALLQSGQVPPAIEKFQQAERDLAFVEGYSHADFYNDWANAVEQGPEPEKALELYDKALRKEADNGHAWFKRGELLERLGRREEALSAHHRADEAFARFIREHPGGGRYSEHVFTEWGKSLSVLGRLEEAAERFRRALQHNPRHEDARQALTALDVPAAIEHPPPGEASGELTPTVAGVKKELGQREVSALEAVRSIVRRHTEYAGGRARVLLEGDDPTKASRQPVEAWLQAVRRRYPRGVIDGRRFILSLAFESPALRELMAQSALLEPLSLELLGQVLQYGGDRRCALGIACGGRFLARGNNNLVSTDIPLRAIRLALPSDGSGLPGVLSHVESAFRALSVESSGSGPSLEMPEVALGPSFRSSTQSKLITALASSEAEPLPIVLARTLEGREQLVLLVDNYGPAIESIEQFRLDALPKEFFEPGPQRLVIVVSGVADDIVGDGRVSFHLLAQDRPLSPEEMLEYYYYLFVVDPGADLQLLEALDARRLEVAHERLFKAPLGGTLVRSHLDRWRQEHPAPDPLWKHWMLATRGDDLRAKAWFIDP